MKGQSTAYEFDSIIVLQNSKSKNAAIAQQHITKLRKHYPKRVTVIESSPELATTRHTILDTITRQIGSGKHPIFAIAGGDGTVNLVLQTLVSPSAPDYARKVPLLPLGTGNANDLAHMLYARPGQLDDILPHAQPVDIRPLECVIYTTGNKRIPERRVASNYISVGAMAHGAYELNRPDVRSDSGIQKRYGDFLAVRAAVQAPSFTIIKDGKQYLLRDILFGNGERVAKIGRMPARLDKPELYAAMVEDDHFGRVSIMRSAIQLALGRMPGDMLRDMEYCFTVLENVPAQFDGEPSDIVAGSTIHIRHANMTFRALSTKLAP